MKLVFAAGDAFAVPALEALAAKFAIVNVVATPDRPAGRGMKITRGPIPSACDRLGLPCQQPTSNEELLAVLQSDVPDFLVTCAYGRKLDAAALATPKQAAINIHASLLPRWRGAAPIEHAILAGDSETGITTMLMAERIDAGAILLQEKVPIDDKITGGNLREKLSEVAASVIVSTLEQFATLTPLDQDKQLVTKAPRIDKSQANIDWTKPALEIQRLIRAFNPHPGAFTFINGKRIKILEAVPVDNNGTPGTILELNSGGLVVACGEQALLLTTIQPANKRPQSSADWLRGNHDQITVGMQTT